VPGTRQLSPYNYCGAGILKTAPDKVFCVLRERLTGNPNFGCPGNPATLDSGAPDPIFMTAGERRERELFTASRASTECPLHA
jgi:hypothetical protein